MLKRNITTTELVAINRMFALGRGYKDLIRDFKKDFNIELPKATAKEFMKNRKWQDVLKWLTGEEIETTLTIPELEPKRYELLEAMLKVANVDNEEQRKLLNEFTLNDSKFYIPEDVKYFNFPMYGEIITYKRKEPFVKCFLLNEKRKIDKIEDVFIDSRMPELLLTILRTINKSPILTTNHEKYINDTINYIETNDERTNIFTSPLFKYFNISYK